VNTVPKMSIA